MSEHPNEQGDFGRNDLDPAEQADAERFLDDPSAGDDEPWSPPERLPRGAELIGTETEGGETLDQRLQQEEPEEQVDGEQIETVGGDDPDAIPADQDVLGGPAGSDDVRRGGSPEEDAMRVVEDDQP
jgi:hypothetical protein